MPHDHYFDDELESLRNVVLMMDETCDNLDEQYQFVLAEKVDNLRVSLQKLIIRVGDDQDFQKHHRHADKMIQQFAILRDEVKLLHAI